MTEAEFVCLWELHLTSLETKLGRDLISLYICDHHNCSDSNNKQYPDCELITDNDPIACPLLGSGVDELTNDIVIVIK